MSALLSLFLTALATLMAGLFGKKSLVQPVAFLGTAFALGCAVCTEVNMKDPFWNHVPMMSFGPLATAFSIVALLSMLLLLGLVRFSFRDLEKTLGDHLGLMLFSLCGALCLFSFTNLTMLFLGVEILSIPLYVLAGSRRDSLGSNEAALKYFLMGCFATGILLFGVALVFGATGSFDLQKIAASIADGRANTTYLHVGILLMTVGMCFKVGAVPFHFWSPDVYEGSPSLVTAFMATVVKTAGFAAFFLLFRKAFDGAANFWEPGLAAIAGITMILANTTAIFQNNFKRMMAYSSVSHTGYLLLGLLGTAGAASSGAVLLYLLTYSVATICAFAVFIAVSEQSGSENFGAFEGLSKRSPMLAAVMALSVLSLAGIPPLAGFFGKYFLFVQAFEKWPWLVVVAVLNSAVSIYYYFRVIIAMYFEEPSREAVAVPRGFGWVVVAGLAIIALICLAPGAVLAMV